MSFDFLAARKCFRTAARGEGGEGDTGATNCNRNNNNNNHNNNDNNNSNNKETSHPHNVPKTKKKRVHKQRLRWLNGNSDYE
uniref:Putative serine/threonine-protein kinase ndrd n=1 Tax=Ixodes ricinus TaxID=34613 RepID=A0A131XSA0_IXORI